MGPLGRLAWIFSYHFSSTNPGTIPAILPCMSYKPNGFGELQAHRLGTLPPEFLLYQPYCSKFAIVVAKRILGRRSGTAGILPFRLGRQAVAVGLGQRQPAPFAIRAIPGRQLLLLAQPSHNRHRRRSK